MGLIFKPDAILPVPTGRVTLYSPRNEAGAFIHPIDGMFYSFGLDFALGIPGKDRDACVGLDSRHEQVVTLQGNWGETFLNVLVPVIEFFGKHRVFIVGENTAHGIPWLRWLYDHGYWVYCERDAKTRGNTLRDKLGHTPVNMDPTVTGLRAEIGKGAAGCRLKMYDPELYSECCKFGFKPRSQAMDVDEARDSHLIWGAPSGEFDDLVRAAGLANEGLKWMARFDPPKPKPKAGSIGEMLEVDKDPDYNPRAVVPQKKSRWATAAAR